MPKYDDNESYDSGRLGEIKTVTEIFPILLSYGVPAFPYDIKGKSLYLIVCTIRKVTNLLQGSRPYTN